MRVASLPPNGGTLTISIDRSLLDEVNVDLRLLLEHVGLTGNGQRRAQRLDVRHRLAAVLIREVAPAQDVVEIYELDPVRLTSSAFTVIIFSRIEAISP